MSSANFNNLLKFSEFLFNSFSNGFENKSFSLAFNAIEMCIAVEIRNSLTIYLHDH